MGGGVLLFVCCFFWFSVSRGSYAILGEVSLVTGRFGSRLAEAPSNIITLMMVVWTVNGCCVSVDAGIVFFGGHIQGMVIRVKSIQRLTSPPLSAPLLSQHLPV